MFIAPVAGTARGLWAIYRFNNDGWDYNQAYKEMKNYDFYTRWGHGEIKKYVEDYWQTYHAKNAGPAAASVSVKATS
jgi:hypothetical protein